MQGRRYRVKAGESLSSIAAAHLGGAQHWPQLFAYNNRADVVSATRHRLADPDRIAVGQLVMIPPHRMTGRRHPRQTTIPRVAGPTAKAAQVPAAAPPARPSSPKFSTPNFSAQGQTSTTTVNSFPFKYKLDLIPKQTIEGPNYTATMTFDGAVTIWLDKQIPLAMLTNRGAELSAKHETDGIFAKLVQSQKVSWEPNSRKATYENMLTVNAHGASPSLASVGYAVTTDNPIPAMRFKFTTPLMQGKLGQHLYIAENFTVVMDLRPKEQDLDNTRQPEPVRVPVRAPEPQPEGFWQHTGHWVADHKVEIGVSVVVTAVLVTNILTLGTDAEVDVPVAAWAARTLVGAGAVAPALAH